VTRGIHRKLPFGSTKGVPDIIVLKDGKFTGIEAKACSGRLSPDQAGFAALYQEWWRRHRRAKHRRPSGSEFVIEQRVRPQLMR
jgi:hypothetical protein